MATYPSSNIFPCIKNRGILFQGTGGQRKRLVVILCYGPTAPVKSSAVLKRVFKQELNSGNYTHLITKSLLFLRVFMSGCYSVEFHSSKCLVNLWVSGLLSRLALIICFTSWNLFHGCVGRHLESNQVWQHSTCSCSLGPKRVFWLWCLRGGISGADGSKNTWGFLWVFIENKFLNSYWELFLIPQWFDRLLILLNFYLGKNRGMGWWSTFLFAQLLYFLTIVLFFLTNKAFLSILYSTLKCSCNQMKHFDFCQNKICQELAWDSILVCYGWNLLSWRILKWWDLLPDGHETGFEITNSLGKMKMPFLSQLWCFLSCSLFTCPVIKIGCWEHLQQVSAERKQSRFSSCSSASINIAPWSGLSELNLGTSTTSSSQNCHNWFRVIRSLTKNQTSKKEKKKKKKKKNHTPPWLFWSSKQL